MCGNFDGDPLNEFMSPNNHLYDNVRLFGDSWAYISPTTAGPLTAPVSDTLGLDQVHPCSLLDSVSVMISNNLFYIIVGIFHAMFRTLHCNLNHFFIFVLQNKVNVIFVLLVHDKTYEKCEKRFLVLLCSLFGVKLEFLF